MHLVKGGFVWTGIICCKLVQRRLIQGPRHSKRKPLIARAPGGERATIPPESPRPASATVPRSAARGRACTTSPPGHRIAGRPGRLRSRSGPMTRIAAIAEQPTPVLRRATAIAAAAAAEAVVESRLATAPTSRQLSRRRRCWVGRHRPLKVWESRRILSGEMYS